MFFDGSSKGGQHGTLAESVPYGPPQAKMGPYCPPWRAIWDISSHIALLGGQYGTAVPYCPPWRAIWDGPPALGKKEGGKQIWSQGGQYGTPSRME